MEKRRGNTAGKAERVRHYIKPTRRICKKKHKAGNEAILTPKEYEQYQKELAECESMAQQELVDRNLVIMGAIADSAEMQITGEENQLIIMGAIADLYESIMDAIANIKTTS